MRFGAYLVMLTMLAAGAGAQDFSITPMPAGGLPVIQPGFSFRSPGLGWFLAGNIKPENGVIRGGGTAKIYFSHGAEGRPDAEVYVDIVHWPAAMVGTPDLRRYLREHSSSGGKPSTNPRIRESVSDEVLNGAACVVFRFEYDHRSKADTALTTTFAGRRVCAHPEMPGFALDLQYYADTAQSNAAIAAVVESLSFTPLPYRVREIRPGCQIGTVVEADGALWTVCRPDDSHTPGKVLRIDPATNHVTATIEVGPKPWNLNAVRGQIWVSDLDDNNVLRIDPKTNAVTATVSLPSPSYQLLAADGFVWALTFDLHTGMSLLRINPASASIDANIPLGGFAIGVEAGRWLYIENIKDHAWTRRDGRTGEAVDGLALSRQILGIKYDGRFAWVLQNESGSTALLKFDPEHPAPPERIRLLDGRVDDVLWWNGAFCTVGVQVLRCRGSENGPVNEFPQQPAGLRVFAGSLWGPSLDGTAILRLDPK